MTEPSSTPRLDERILIFAPVGKDAPLTAEIFERAGLAGCVCRTANGLCNEFERGAAAILLTEEALEDSSIDAFMSCLRSQPAWSDVPILLFADAERSEVYLRTLSLLEGLRNVILLDRPIRLGAALSLIKSAIRGRHRQYELRDLLSALAEAREAAVSANRVKDEFLATLSHELRTPLNAILGWTTMLRDGNVQPAQVMRALDTIHRNAMAQVQIVNDVLDISRIVRGTVQLSPKAISLGPLLMLAVESIAPTAEAKGITITTSIADEAAEVWADPDRLQQIFWNLLSNAVKFTGGGDRIEVSMQREGGEAWVRVRDTGQGIAPSFLPHVFERFRQGDGSPTRMHGGLGLGLSIARHLVELHGGWMRAESDGEGLGATFTVVLPIRDAQKVDAQPARPVQRTIALIDKHVLIVDDQPDARELLRAMLEPTGARISEAGSADEALKSIADDAPDLLLADVAMPHRDGYALIRDVRRGPDGSRIRAIAVSAYAHGHDKKRALAEGFDSHVSKPVNRAELLAAIERVFNLQSEVEDGQIQASPGVRRHALQRMADPAERADGAG
jgi:signal transduction histidine kinase/DNA-binding NarL/FixJ family response regulator